MLKRYWLRYWEPSMDTEETLEKLDFDPGCAGFGAREIGGGVDWRTDSFLFIAYGFDLWYASKVVGIVRLEDTPDFHIAVAREHQNKGIGAVLIYRALQYLADYGGACDSLETVATPDGAALLTKMFGFKKYDDACVKKWKQGHGWLDGVKPAIAGFLEKTICDMSVSC